MRSRTVRNPERGCIVEPLEGRVLCHAGHEGLHIVGTLVPWTHAPIAPIVIVPPALPSLPPPAPPPAAPPVGSPAVPPPIAPNQPVPQEPGPTEPPGAAQPQFSAIQWTDLRPSATPLAESLRGIYGNRLYLFGGFSGSTGPVVNAQYFDTASGAWGNIRSLPERITHAGVAQTGSDVYFVGGYVGNGPGYQQAFGSSHVWKYNFESDNYDRLTDLPRKYAGGGAEIIDGKLHYFGGYTQQRQDTNVHLVLDLNDPSARWQEAATMLTARNHMGHVVYGGRIFSIAGQTGTDEGLVTRRDVEVFDPATNTWSYVSPIPRGVSHISSATFVMGDRIIVAGGESVNYVQVREVWAYTPATDRWEALTPLPAPRFSGVAAAFAGKIVFATGGSSTSNWLGTPVLATGV